MPASVLRWSGRDLAERLPDPRVLDDLVDAAVLVVDVRDDPAADGADGDILRRACCPVVVLAAEGGTPRLPADLVLTEGSADERLLGTDATAAADRLAAAAAQAPGAAGVLVHLLRTTTRQPVVDALLAESIAYSMLLTAPEFRQWLADHPPPSHRDDGSPAVLARRVGDVLTLTLNRPGVHNAFDAATRDGLVEGLSLARYDPTLQRVVLTGAGPSFCSGGDLAEFGGSDDPVRAHRIRTTRSVGALLHAVRDRLEARVHGACVGAGVELPAFAGQVVAAEDTTFRLPEVAMGLLPGAGGTVSLPRRIGPQRTLLLALSGIELPAADALRWGLVDAIDAGP